MPERLRVKLMPVSNKMKKHAFVIAGVHSGCGKTTLSLALMAAFRKRGLKVQPFKIGPDFIDPGLHTQITGVHSRNLDGWMLTRRYNETLFLELLACSDIAIVEGVMGLFDGYDGIGEAGSTAEMAKWLKLPVVLIVDARSMARSAAAVVHGFKYFDPDLHFAGVIFNRIAGKRHLDYLRQAMETNLPEVRVLGGIPRNEEIAIPERHLGLITSDEFTFDESLRERLAGLVEKHLDFGRLLEISRYSGTVQSAGEKRQGSSAPAFPVIAVARDAAFCFYYPDNLALLEQMGARLHFFSPLAGETFPGDAAGLYLGGGYPELFAAKLAEQKMFFEHLREAAGRGIPIYAECGGLMVLGRAIETLQGDLFPMAAILPFKTKMLKRVKMLGYTEVVLRKDCILGKVGLVIRGHEFHYSEIAESEDDASLELAYDIKAKKGGASRREGYMQGNVLASYVHLHWGSEPVAARNLVSACREYSATGRINPMLGR